MKILAAGDFHGDRSLAKRLAQQAEDEDVDVVILNGDLVPDHQPEGVVGHFCKEDRTVVLVRGNHESPATADFLAELYDAVNLHGYSIRMGDVGFFGCGGANVGLHQLTEDEIYTELKKGFHQIKDAKTKVLVSHVHPAGTTMERLTQFLPGSSGLRRAIESFKPEIVLCGHVHEAEGIEEKIGRSQIMNVGTQGKILEL